MGGSGLGGIVFRMTFSFCSGGAFFAAGGALGAGAGGPPCTVLPSPTGAVPQSSTRIVYSAGPKVCISRAKVPGPSRMFSLKGPASKIEKPTKKSSAAPTGLILIVGEIPSSIGSLLTPEKGPNRDSREPDLRPDHGVFTGIAHARIERSRPAYPAPTNYRYLSGLA